MNNPFLNNTPKTSPQKPHTGNKVYKKTPSSTTSSTPSTSSLVLNKSGYHGTNSNVNIYGSNSTANSTISSPIKRPRTSGSIEYTDRYIPSRTELGLNSMTSLGTKINLPPSKNIDQLELQRERQAYDIFDTVLKNEIFGDLLSRDSNYNERTIDKIKNTRLPTTPSPERIKYRRNSISTDTANTAPSTTTTDTNINIHNHDLDNTNNRNSSNSNNPNNSINLSSTASTTSNNNVIDINNHDDNGYIDTDDDNQMNSSISAPITPRKLFSNDDLYKPSSNSIRGASMFTYRERPKSKRPSSTSLLLHSSQFLDSKSPVRPDSKQLLLSPSKNIRKIEKIPYRVLDAPSLADDFYYDLVDWSAKDIVAVALNTSIFLTNNNTGDVIHLCDTEDEFTSLNWVGSGSHLAVGRNDGIVEIYDVEKKKCIRTLPGHFDRVACLSWNNHVLTSGSRDHKILHRDVRSSEQFFEKISTHSQEVCGLKWNVQENKLASGGNDNTVYVYDGCSKIPNLKISEHKAAVKAMAWSPHKRGVLATGGGTADRTLKIWNTINSTKINDIDTNSQICNMIWSKNTDEIVTSHGYSKYHLTLWNAPTLEPIAILKGHSFRVLHLTLSADGTTVVSGAGDETLRYWKLFEKPKPRLNTNSSLLDSMGGGIR